jgi:hypothetical protein
LDRGSSRRKTATFPQNKTNTEQTQTDIHALSGLRTHDSSIRASEDISCLRPRGHCGRLLQLGFGIVSCLLIECGYFFSYYLNLSYKTILTFDDAVEIASLINKGPIVTNAVEVLKTAKKRLTTLWACVQEVPAFIIGQNTG